MNEQKKILVTGGNGFIGSNIINYYNKKKYIVHNIGTQNSSNVHVEKYHKVDIRNLNELIKIAESYDVIYHCAGSASVPNSISNPKNDFDINALGTFNILEYSRKSNSKKVIYLSTVSVNGDENKLPLNENSIKKPVSPYGASKLCGENYCNVYSNCYGLDVRIARIYNVYGPGLHKLFIYDLIKKIKNSKTYIEIFGDGKQVRDYLYVDDLIRAIILICNKGESGGAYDLSSGNPIQISQIIDKVVSIMGVQIDIIYNNNSYKGDIKEWYGKPDKICGLGFKQLVSLDAGLKRTIKHLRNNK
tara:strand:+ start:6440 stop:7348 length:909 start_codon:yes stop_codon:yes gene_type:complete